MNKNLDPVQHPFQKAREYTRALNAAKIDKIYAQPFIGALTGHKDGIFAISRHPTSLSTVFSGACDGGIQSLN